MTEKSDTGEKPAKKAAEPRIPEGYTLMSEAEHNRIQAELRKLKADAEKRDADAARIAAEASGEYQKALAAEQERRIRAETAANNLAVQDAIRTEILRRGLTGDKAVAAQKLVDASRIAAESGVVTDTNSARNAVESVFVNFKSLFAESPTFNEGGDKGTTESGEEKRAAEVKPTPKAGPATPQDGTRKPTGYISPEEYVATPASERLSPEFQKRVEASQSHWPSEVPASTFGID